MFGAGHDGEIPEDVVRPHVVDVVDDLVLLQRTAKRPLRDDAGLLAVHGASAARSRVHHAVAVAGLPDAAAPPRVHRADLRLHAAAALDGAALKVGAGSDSLAPAVAPAAPEEMPVGVASAAHDDEPSETPAVDGGEVVAERCRALQLRLAPEAACRRILRVAPAATRKLPAADGTLEFVGSI